MKLKVYALALFTIVGTLAAMAFVSSDSQSKSTTLFPVAEAADAAEARTPIQVEQIQIVETAELMKLLVDPMFEELKDAVENPPEKRRHWRSLYIAAFNLAELSNLNFSRRDDDYMSTTEWVEFCIKSRDLSIALADSVKGQADYSIIKNNFLALTDNCNDCHTKFEPGEVDKIEVPESWKENAAGEKEDIPL
ncbi:MAG: hypothetical protein COA73_06460 [Candidatus Hydrogenedentota bacterium]|nr:MAG: hypothetical protein COA73_06460 [Candidatus Hydrogenedentota bacterium]